MSVTAIRRSKRFAVRRGACIQTQSGNVLRGLLVEISLDGCRLGGLTGPDGDIGENVALAIDGVAPLAAQVGCVVNGSVGLRFSRPLHLEDLNAIIAHCRHAQAQEQAMCFGT